MGVGAQAEMQQAKAVATGVAGFTLLVLGCIGLIASQPAQSERWDIIQSGTASGLTTVTSFQSLAGNSTGATGILGVVSKFNGKQSFDEHVYNVIKKHGDFPVDHAVDFMRDVSAYNKKTEEHLDTEAQAYDAIHAAAKNSS